MAYISNNFIEGCVSLKGGETTRSKAKKTLFKVIYPEETDRKRLKKMFDGHLRSVAAYHRLYKHYGNDGILAMFPTSMRENTMLRALPVFTIFLEVLDLVRPDLHGARSRFFSPLIEELFHRRTISQSMMNDLAS